MTAPVTLREAAARLRAAGVDSPDHDAAEILRKTIDAVFADPQVLSRGMLVEMPHSTASAGSVKLIGSPLKLSATPVKYRRSPPLAGEHTNDVLSELRSSKSSAPR